MGVALEYGGTDFLKGIPSELGKVAKGLGAVYEFGAACIVNHAVFIGVECRAVRNIHIGNVTSVKYRAAEGTNGIGKGYVLERGTLAECVIADSKRGAALCNCNRRKSRAVKVCVSADGLGACVYCKRGEFSTILKRVVADRLNNCGVVNREG